MSNVSTRIMSTLVWLFIATSTGDVLAQTSNRSSELLSRAEADGELNVLVTLRVPGADTRSGPTLDAVERAQAGFISRYQSDMKSGTAVEPINGLPIVYLEATSQVLQRMLQDGDVIAIDENNVRFPSLARSHSLIDAEKSWKAGGTGKGFGIAILDTGVDSRHSFFAGRVVEEACFSSEHKRSRPLCPNGLTEQKGRGSANPCKNILGCDHGTHVAGIAAGRMASRSGIAPEADIIAIQVFSDCKDQAPNCTLSALDSDILKGLAHVLQLSSTRKIASVNLSLGGGRYSSQCDGDHTSYVEAFKALRRAGVAVVVASGNDAWSDSLNSPACVSNAISVGSIDKSGQVSEFSNGAAMLTFLAPGGDIESSVPDGKFGTMSGTSMAAPHIAGAFAAIRSRHPNASVDEVVAILEKTGKQIRDRRSSLSKSLAQIHKASVALGNAAAPSPQPPPNQPPPPTPPSPAPSAGARALIIGVDRYQNPKLNLPEASSVRDAENIRELLVSSFKFAPEQIKLLANEQATRDGILMSMNTWLKEGTRAGDRVVFYYSGHGSQVKDRNGDEADGLDETLVPYDAKPSGKNDVLDDEIGKIFDQISDRRITAIFDSCFSGTVTRSLGLDTASADLTIKRPPDELVDGFELESSELSTRGEELFNNRSAEDAFLKRAQNRIVWTAASNTQYAFVEQITPPSGFYTNRFIAGLKDKRADSNRNGLISFAELQAFIRKESDAFCRARSCSLGLTPTLEAPADVLGRDIISGAADEDPTGEIGDTIGPGPGPSDLELTLLPGNEVKVGQSFRYRVRSPAAGFLLLLDLDAGGRLRQIFPNKYTRSSNGAYAIAANSPVTLPEVGDRFRMVADEPTGSGTLIGIVTSDPVNFEDLTSRNLSFEDIEEDSFAGQVAERLLKVWSENLAERSVRYTVKYVNYKIVQ